MVVLTLKPNCRTKVLRKRRRPNNRHDFARIPATGALAAMGLVSQSMAGQSPSSVTALRLSLA